MKNLSKKYLSIGEVSKLTKVSHTSLRYYDEIGILKPAYINQDTGYRYYAKNQLPILSLILLAIDLDIPLKELEKYLQENSGADLEDFTQYAKKKVHKSIKKLQRDMYFLNSVEKHFQENTKNFSRVDFNNTYNKEIDERYFLTLPYDTVSEFEVFDFSDYWEKMTDLYTLIADYDISSSVEQGIIYQKKENVIISKYFVEIKKVKKKAIEEAEIIHIPKGDFLCSFYPETSIEEATHNYLSPPFFQHGDILVVLDVLEKKINKKILPFEMQILKR